MSSLISFFVGGTLFNFNYTPIGLTRGWHWSKRVFLPSGKGRRPPPCGRICWPRGPWEEDQASPLVSTPKHNTTINHQTLHIVPVSFVDLFHIHAILIRSRKIYFFFFLHKNVWTMNKTFWQKKSEKITIGHVRFDGRSLNNWRSVEECSSTSAEEKRRDYWDQQHVVWPDRYSLLNKY